MADGSVRHRAADRRSAAAADARRCGRCNTAVLVAPPGAGKTTRVPLWLLDALWAADKKILVLEPRRLAARAAAERMAATLNESVGETVGLRVRFGSKVSRKTRIEVVTEGIFTRLILDDPSLDGVAAVLFDEFHERSLDADLGLALARDVQQGLRDDLRLVVMSATLDGARVAKLLGDAPVIESEGRAFPVETRYLGRDASSADRAAGGRQRWRGRLRADPGSILAFLPGPGGNPPHRNAAQGARHRSRGGHRDALRRARRADPGSRHLAGAGGPAQGGAGDLDRRDLAHHRGRAHRHRLRARAGAALRARRRPDAAGNRAGVARRRRSAPRPRRPHRARRLLPAVGRAADRLARSLCAAGDAVRRSVGNAARSGAMGRGRSRQARVPRSAAGRRADRGEGAAHRARRHRRASAASPTRAESFASCRCRRGSPAWWSMRRRKARASALPTLPRSCRSAGLAATTSISATGSISFAATARAAARMRGGWRSAGRTTQRALPPTRALRKSRSRRRDPVAGLSRPHRQEPRRQRRVPAGQRPRRQRRSGLGAGARAVSRRGGAGRHRRAEPHSARGADHAGRDRAALRRPASNAARTSASMPRRQACAAAAASGSARSRWPSGRMPVDARPEAAKHARRGHRPAWASTGCRGRSRCSNGATA